jgi:hypothetical protein
MGEREAIHNIFMMTSKAIKRFGLWDENFYPAFCEGEPCPQNIDTEINCMRHLLKCTVSCFPASMDALRG